MLVTTALKYHQDHGGRKRRAGGIVILSSPLQCLGCLDLPGKKKKAHKTNPPKNPKPSTHYHKLHLISCLPQLYLYGCGAVHPTAPFRSSSLRSPPDSAVETLAGARPSAAQGPAPSRAFPSASPLTESHRAAVSTHSRPVQMAVKASSDPTSLFESGHESY